MSARKIGFLILLLGFGAAVETAWQVRGDWRIGPEGCRVIGGRFYGPSYSFEQTAERTLTPGEAPRLEVRNAFGGVSVTAGAPGVVKVKLRKVVFLPTEEKAQAFAERVELRLSGDGALVKVGHQPRRDRPRPGHRLRDAPRDRGAGRDRRRDPQRARARRPRRRGERRRRLLLRRRLGREARGRRSSSRPGTARSARAGSAPAWSSPPRHGNVEVSDVTGPAKLDVEHGDLSARQTGPLEVAIQYGGFDAEGVAGDLVVRGGHAGVRASDVTGRAEVETSFERDPPGARGRRRAREGRSTARSPPRTWPGVSSRRRRTTA